MSRTFLANIQYMRRGLTWKIAKNIRKASIIRATIYEKAAKSKSHPDIFGFI